MTEAPRQEKVRPGSWPLSAVAAGLLVSFAAFFLYLRTLAPTVLYYAPGAFPDSVLLQVKAYVLSIPNPTGYPTYILIAHLFTRLPFGDPAFRVNLASAVFAALAVLVLFWACRTLVGRTLPAAVAALLFGLGQTFWSQAVITEVYTLNALLIALVLLSLFVWRERRSARHGDRYLLLSAFLIGLAMTDHMTSALLLPTAFLFVWLVDRSRLTDLRLVLRGAGLFALALTPYLYLPVRAAMDPPLNETDPSTPGRFLELVTGANFESRMLAFGPADLPGRLAMYLDLLVQQFNPLFLLVAAIGVGYLAERDRPALALAGALYAGWLLYALEYDIPDVGVYFIPTYMMLSIPVAAGVSAIIRLVFWLARGWNARAGRAAFLSVAALLLLSTFLGVPSTYAAVDQSDDYRGMKTIEAVEEDVAPGATVLHSGSSLWYLREVLETRPDLDLIDPFGPGEWQPATDLWARRADHYLSRGPVYVLLPPNTVYENLPYFEQAGLTLYIVDDKQNLYRVKRGEDYEKMPLSQP